MKLDKDLVSQQASETAANVVPFGYVSLRAGLVKPSLMERQETMTAAFQLALISSMYGCRIDHSRRGPLIRWAHQRQENLIDNLVDSIVRQGLEGHQDLVACKVRR